jgi:hypothetical protein
MFSANVCAAKMRQLAKNGPVPGRGRKRLPIVSVKSTPTSGSMVILPARRTSLTRRKAIRPGRVRAVVGSASATKPRPYCMQPWCRSATARDNSCRNGGNCRRAHRSPSWQRPGADGEKAGCKRVFSSYTGAIAFSGMPR